ncbi:ROK family protein [Vibrio aquaticus]|uniref:ROK family protein n=1 Tax=Vibrio aquaticus TaxID=2496559 RepID=A0A3S0MMK4_9VIBR|nr:N-acetylmannosamine kinase [Vibrio aquaticus]RTZ18024.1 ROK family protein [Vibrio aquaticus]
MSNVLSIDIGGTKVAIGYVSDGKLKESIRISTPKINDVETFVDCLLKVKPNWIKQSDMIGISTTGFVKEQSITAINPDTLRFPHPFPLQRVIHQKSQLPTIMINDAQAAAWYEYSFIDNVKNMAYLTVSTGVGGGIIINGKLVEGIAGHVGHTKVSDIIRCGCGRTGCVEAIASGTAVLKRANEEIDPDITNVELFKLAETDSRAYSIINHSAKAIAALCANLKVSLNLEAIVIGGGIGLAENYLNLVKAHIKSKPDFAQIDIMPANGGHNSCLLGAAYLAAHTLKDK